MFAPRGAKENWEKGNSSHQAIFEKEQVCFTRSLRWRWWELSFRGKSDGEGVGSGSSDLRILYLIPGLGVIQGAWDVGVAVTAAWWARGILPAHRLPPACGLLHLIPLVTSLAPPCVFTVCLLKSLHGSHLWDPAWCHNIFGGLKPECLGVDLR